MTRRRFAAFAVASIVVSVLFTGGVVLASDIYLHRKYADVAGLNVWGYRGLAVGRKQRNEWRLAVLGESTAFGYGVHWRESIPAYLQHRLNSSAAPGRGATVVNLAYNNEAAYSFKFTLRDYEYLDYDAVLLYSGYNDLSPSPSPNVFRHRSAVFRLTGYLPILPLILEEKAMTIRYGGRLEDAYFRRTTTFKPNVTQRATASALEAAADISKSLERQLSEWATADRMAADTPRDSAVHYEATLAGVPCGPRWARYCGEMFAAIELALDSGKHVLMATQPYISPEHVDQQQGLRKFLEERFPGEPRLRFAHLGHELDLKDPALAYDGMHLTPRGNQQIAAALEPHVRAMMK